MQPDVIKPMKETSFYLHSNQNRRLYLPSKYPLTHFLDYQSLHQRLLKQPTYVKHFKYTFLLLLLLILISTIFFRTHIYIYNAFFGPFHQNFEQFISHIANFEKGQSWLKRMEYIQIELGENNIQNPAGSYDTIRRYADPFIRRHHIATYKKVKKPNIYVKLPTRSQNNFHAHLPFHFSSYSIRTLQCIVKNLQSNQEPTYNTWVEKSEFIKYINEEYAKNSTLFNMLVMTKCGILIGYLYRPVYERAFIRTGEHTFYTKDIAFDAQRQYCSYYPLLLYTLIFLWLFLKALFYLLIYLSNLIRYKFFDKYGILSFPLNLSSNVIEELWLLNLEGSPQKQLLQLDQLIDKSQHQFNKQLFIVENHFGQLYVVLLNTKLDEECYLENDLSPFFICPVADIRKIVQYGGICYGEDSSWIPWPSSTTTDEQNYSEWLHEELMEISEYYQNQYEYRLRHEQGNQLQSSWDVVDSHSYSDSLEGSRIHRRRQARKTETGDKKELKQFIREEENFQRLQLERQLIFDRLFNQTNPASPQFIAKFRLEQKRNQHLVDSSMEKQEHKCTICLDYFKADDSYEKWPCPSKTPHLFHYDCMLNTLRRKNTCPICRHPIETNQRTNDSITQFLTSLVF